VEELPEPVGTKAYASTFSRTLQEYVRYGQFERKGAASRSRSPNSYEFGYKRDDALRRINYKPPVAQAWPKTIKASRLGSGT